MSLHFTILGAPRTKKTSQRIVHVGAFVKVLPSKQYQEWFKNSMRQAPLIRRSLEEQGGSLPLTGEVRVQAIFYRDAVRGDLLGYAQGLADYLQEPALSRTGKPRRKGAGVILDDAQIVSWDGTRALVDRANPRIEVEITAERGTAWLWGQEQQLGDIHANADIA